MSIPRRSRMRHARGFERCAREGSRGRKSQAVRAHVPAVFWSFAIPGATCSERRRDHKNQGAVPHLRLALGQCEFCGNQRSMKRANQVWSRTLLRPDQF